MPQLMPLNWMFSFSFVILMLVLYILYYSVILKEIIFNKSDFCMNLNKWFW